MLIKNQTQLKLIASFSFFPFLPPSGCSPLNSTSELKDYLDSLYTDAAQYDEPPKYPVSRVCGAIDGAEGTDTLDKIFAAVVTYMGNTSCYDMEEFGSPTSTYDMFTWQVT